MLTHFKKMPPDTGCWMLDAGYWMLVDDPNFFVIPRLACRAVALAKAGSGNPGFFLAIILDTAVKPRYDVLEYQVLNF